MGVSPYRLGAAAARELNGSTVFNLAGFDGGINDRDLALTIITNDGFVLTKNKNHHRSWGIALAQNIVPRGQTMTLITEVNDIGKFAEQTPAVRSTLKLAYGGNDKILESALRLADNSAPLPAHIVTITVVDSPEDFVDLATVSVTLLGLSEAQRPRWRNFVTAFVYVAQQNIRPVRSLPATESMKIAMAKNPALRLRARDGLLTLNVEIEDNGFSKTVNLHSFTVRLVAPTPPLQARLESETQKPIIAPITLTNTAGVSLFVASVSVAGGVGNYQYQGISVAGETLHVDPAGVISIPASLNSLPGAGKSITFAIQVDDSGDLSGGSPPVMLSLTLVYIKPLPPIAAVITDSAGMTLAGQITLGHVGGLSLLVARVSASGGTGIYEYRAGAAGGRALQLDSTGVIYMPASLTLAANSTLVLTINIQIDDVGENSEQTAPARTSLRLTWRTPPKPLRMQALFLDDTAVVGGNLATTYIYSEQFKPANQLIAATLTAPLTLAKISAVDGTPPYEIRKTGSTRGVGFI